jgi:ABC-2 type transport system permease protein
VVFHWDRNATPYTKIDYYYAGLEAANSLLAVTWILAVTLLAMGGLLREKSSGASGFTLALPVSRTRLMTVRIGVALAQATTLVIVPWVAMFLIGSIAGKTHSIPQAAFYITLLLGGGLVFFAMAILVSSLVEGEYTAPVVIFGLIIVTAIALGDPSLRTYSPWALMIGDEYIDKHTYLLRGPIPWLHVAANICVSVLFLLMAVKAIQKREF